MVDIFIFILLSFFSSPASSSVFSFFADFECLHSSRTLERKTFLFFHVQGANYLGFRNPRRAARLVRGSSILRFFFRFILNVISHCRFRMKFFFFANPTSLICFSSLPIPPNNSHIGWRGATRLSLLRPRSNLPHHLTNSSLFFIIYFVISSLDCVNFFSFRILIPPSI